MDNEPWIICFHCGRVSLRPDWDASDDWCPYAGCDGSEGDDLLWEEVQKYDATLPMQPERNVSYSTQGWWEMRQNSPEVEEARKRYADSIEEMTRKLAQ